MGTDREHSKPLAADLPERRCALRDQVSTALAHSPSLVEALPSILRALCEALDCRAGALWTVDPKTGRLACLRQYGQDFEAAVRRSTFARGEGLPGRVWASGEVLFEDSIGVPISSGTEALGAFELFTAGGNPPTPEWMETLRECAARIAAAGRSSARDTLDRFFTLSVDMLCIAGYDGYYKRLNPAWTRTLGYSIEELMAQPFVDFVHPADRDATIAETRKLAAGGDTISFENRYRAKNGSYKWLLWNATPFATQQLIYAAARDITDRKRSEEKMIALREDAEAATRAKSEFLARMSHEIRTPLNVVIGMGDLLERTALNTEQHQYIRVLQRAGTTLLALINDVLDLSKVESGRVALEEIDFDLAETIEGAVEIMSARAKEKGIELSHEIAAGVAARVVGDPGRLRQVLINLLGNAIKFTAAGSIHIRVEPDPEHPAAGELRFSVTDTGVGIPAEKLESIFEAFTQADASTTRKFGGTGLGLSISKHLVELMNGRIWAESSPGRGTTFYFTSRFADAPAKSAHAPETSAARSSLAGSMSSWSILIVDDSEENRFLVSEYLKDLGCRMDFAEDGQQAVEKFGAGAYDLVLMDLQMPILDGYDAASRMRALECDQKRAPTPILALTASALESEVRKALDAGCNECLRKPIRLSVLLEAIGRYAPRSATVSAAPIERILVRVDARLREVVPGYLANRRADVDRIYKAIERLDYPAIGELGHKMTGTGLGYGFVRISEIGAALEAASRQRDRDAVQSLVSELSRYIEQVEVVSTEPR